MKFSTEAIAVEKPSVLTVEWLSNEKPEPHKNNGHGIALVPQPSDDPLDPLVNLSRCTLSIIALTFPVSELD
jgi:hypothetical protein